MIRPQKKEAKSRVLNGLAVGISAFMTLLNMGQWFLVSILKTTNLYSFGKQASKPYFYKSADLFALVHLYWGYLFLAIFTLTLLAVWSKKRFLVIPAFGLTMLSIVAYLYHASIGVE